ncbi:isochorismatase family protein [archaeon]|nr:isochorismatase family protein [archaeon]
MKAVLVIDMTEYFLQDKAKNDLENKINNIKSVIETGVENEMPLYFFEFLFQDVYRAGFNSATNDVIVKSWTYPTIKELKEVVKDYDKACFFLKENYDCFLSKPFKNKVKEESIDELVVTGCNVGVCVKNTVRKALTKDLGVVTSESVLLANKSDLEEMNQSIRYFRKKGVYVKDSVADLIEGLNCLSFLNYS